MDKSNSRCCLTRIKLSEFVPSRLDSTTISIIGFKDDSGNENHTRSRVGLISPDLGYEILGTHVHYLHS